MLKQSKINFTKEAVEHLYIDIKNFSKYTEEEQQALCKYTPMTKGLFIKCFEKAFYKCDLEITDYLIENFPEYI